MPPQHLVDLFGQFYGLMRHLLPRLLLLLRGFISRSHASLASVGVAAYARLVSSCGQQLDPEGWTEVSYECLKPRSRPVMEAADHTRVLLLLQQLHFHS